MKDFRSFRIAVAALVLFCALAQFSPTHGADLLSGRNGKQIKERLKKYGAGDEVEKAIFNGLTWLAAHQAPQGYWSLDKFPQHARRPYTPNQATGAATTRNDVAGTAFGLLPFLAIGQTHKEGKWKKTVAAGATSLIQNQDKKTGRYDANHYAHGLAAIAMCELYGLSSDPIVKRSAQMAVDYIIFAQHPVGGGWRYTPKQFGDTSVTGFQLSALQVAKSVGLKVPEMTLQKASKYLDSVEIKGEGKYGYGYTGPGSRPTMTSVGLLSRLHLGASAKDEKLNKGMEFLNSSMTPIKSYANVYYVYYESQLAFHLGGEHWKLWNEGAKDKKGMRDVLLSFQETKVGSPHFGSWDPRGDRNSRQGGRIMKTSTCLLALEVYFRYSPLHEAKQK